MVPFRPSYSAPGQRQEEQPRDVQLERVLCMLLLKTFCALFTSLTGDDGITSLESRAWHARA